MTWTSSKSSMSGKLNYCFELECTNFKHPHARIYDTKDDSRLFNTYFEQIEDWQKYNYVAIIWPDCYESDGFVEIGYQTLEEAKNDIERVFKN